MPLRRRTSRLPRLLITAALFGALVAPPAAAATTDRPPSA
ncbi:hypothetical protein GA0115261_106552, partial [Streptomyces sp. OspMP-M43]